MSQVEIIYVPVDAPTVQHWVTWVANMTVQDALNASGILQQYPELAQCSVGIFSKIVQRETVVSPSDRIELYRPLLGDPKEKRRGRAKK